MRFVGPDTPQTMQYVVEVNAEFKKVQNRIVVDRLTETKEVELPEVVQRPDKVVPWKGLLEKSTKEFELTYITHKEIYQKPRMTFKESIRELLFVSLLSND